ncbi:MAG: UDP-N-acetylglucosamine--N-acetylmuramyl-(pentapeptide) pyrophosphoryl-undecaprenol N-acetylglucosamine transferase [Candidatus Sungbacteria bacterium]|nr:UDP-N-acetylglucosamine--N-acetylmuramyl-(pentapeptide) pyrophosphoryl-undecaprenol N-acetylglucosamine transferase [Candidatus Sungbacteria bacterium]
MRILLTGGGSGGHFFPLIAVARELRRLAEEDKILDVQLFYLGPNDYGKDFLLREDIVFRHIPTGKVRRYASARNFGDFFLTLWGVVHALWQVFVIMPDVVFSKGGYGSFPALLAARVFFLPVVIHDSDAVPGMVSRWSAKFAQRIGVAFPGALQFFPKEKTAVVGNPIRKQIMGGVKERARENFDIFSQKPVVLVLGSSQGAEPINQMVLDGLSSLVGDFEVIHQCGAARFGDMQEQASVILSKEERRFYHLFGFLDEAQYREALAACDVAVSRASAGSIFEIAASGKPSILIPLPHSAGDHQRENAYAYAKATGALVVEEENATSNLLHHTLLRLFASPDQLAKMAAGAATFARPLAAELVAKEILALALSHQ